MLAKTFRFHGHSAVRRAYRQGKPVRNELGTMHVVEDPAGNAPRVAVVVSKKVNKSAVVRNRIRRRIYECIRLHPDHKSFSGGIVLTVYLAEAGSIPYSEVERLVYDLISKSGLTKA